SLHEAYIRVLKKGIATPDLIEKLKSDKKTGVDTLSFIKAVRVELLILLGLKEEAENQASELKYIIKEIR
ncbi:MAG: hypothetical protein IJ846_05280, partial [Alphaproteobacteria bacterium]|nr:hypothetical protein [Alphaproteobacteria bacterium]